MKGNILILSAGRRVELVEIFKKELLSRSIISGVFAADIKPDLSPACHLADKSFLVPKANHGSFINAIVNLCIDEGISIVIPTIDIELKVLSENRQEFINNGIHLVISDIDFINTTLDKRNSNKLFNEIGIKTPKIFNEYNVEYPCIVKPYDGSSSNGVNLIYNRRDYDYFKSKDRKNIFMEFIGTDFQEYSIDAYYDKDRILKSMVPRVRVETRAGEVSKSLTSRNFVYDTILPCLKKIKNARGCITIQIFANHKTHEIFGIEINARFGGGYPLSYESGANFTGWVIDEYLLGKKIHFFEDWERNLMILRFDRNILIKNAATQRN